MNHDIVVIGGSAGAVEVLLNLVGALPSDLPASLFVAFHQSPQYPSLLPELLSQRGPLPATLALHGQRIERGRIYVAPPDNHLELLPGALAVVRGPKENGHRPSIDVLFRTAAVAYGSRVIAVVLSGFLDCGTMGMVSVKARGGVGIVQRPDDAIEPDMPRSVLERLQVDHTVAAKELASVVVQSVGLPALPREPDASVKQFEEGIAGDPAELACPACQGVLTDVRWRDLHRFHCHVGHAFSLRSLMHEQGREVERALWAAVRALEEAAAMADRMSRTSVGDLERRFTDKARTLSHEADVIRHFVLEEPALPEEPSDVAAGTR